MQVAALDDVRRVLADGGTVIEVLGRDEYDWAHLPGALHVPLRRLDAEAASRFRGADPVIVYCNDFL